MKLEEAVKQLKEMRKNLSRYSGPHLSPETVQFKQRSVEAIDTVLEELGRQGGESSGGKD